MTTEKQSLAIKKGLRVYLILFLMVLLYMLIRGYSFYSGDTFDHLPAIIRLSDDPNYLENDWFLNTQSGFTARTYFNYFIFIFSNVFSIKITMFLLFIINTFFLVLGVFSISEFLFKNRLSAYLASFLVLFSVWKLIGDFAIIAPFFTPPQIPITLAIWALYFFLRKKYNVMFLFLGLSTFLHMVTGLNASILLSTALFVKYKFKSFKKFLIGALFYLPPALLTIIPLGLIDLSQEVSSKEVILAYAWIRIPWHIMPSQFSIISYVSFFILLVLFFISLKYTSKSTKHKDIFVILLCALFFFFLGTFFVEIIPSEFIVKIQFFRMIILFRTITLIYIANYFSKKLFSDSNKVFTLIAFASLFDHILILIIPLYLIYDIYIHKILCKKFHLKFWEKDFLSYLLIIFLVIVFVIFFFFGNNFLSKQIYLRLICDFLWVFFVLSLYWLLFVKLDSIKSFKVILSLIVIILCLFSLYFVNNVKITEPEKDEAYAWIGANTPKGSIFIIPPHIVDFRLKVNRAIVINHQAIPFKSNQVIEWKNRLEDVTNHIEFKSAKNRRKELQDGYNSLTEEDFINLQDKYGFDYILVERPKSLDFIILYENNKYVLYGT